MSPAPEGPGEKDAGGAPPPYAPREIMAAENLARTEALSVLGWVREGVRKGTEGGREERDACVFAGRSDRGAAALAAARHLVNYGVSTRALLCGPLERLPALVAAEREILLAMGVRLDEELTGEPLARECGKIGPGTCVVDGAGDPAAPGREGAFARAAGDAARAGRRVRLELPEGYRPPVPTEGDVLFSPDVPARTREEVRLLDSAAIERYRIPGVVLMENAGWRVAREAYVMLGYAREGAGGRALVVAGSGNNGGDGFVAARHLLGWGVDVRAVLVAPRGKVMDDAKVNLELAEESGLEVLEVGLPEAADDLLPRLLEEGGLVIDAILGTGLAGKVRGPAARAIELVNACEARVLAVDTPSGLDANTGEVLGLATTAERTVTFAFAKRGFFLGEGLARTGEVVVADISMPRALWTRGR